MSLIKIERWQCDRCGALEKDRPYVGPVGRRRIRTMTDFGEDKVYDTFDWNDLCMTCNRDVEAEIKAMQNSAAKAREAAADKRCIQLA